MGCAPVVVAATALPPAVARAVAVVVVVALVVVFLMKGASYHGIDLQIACEKPPTCPLSAKPWMILLRSMPWLKRLSTATLKTCPPIIYVCTYIYI